MIQRRTFGFKNFENYRLRVIEIAPMCRFDVSVL
jgi:hypothetical protein